MVNFRNRVHGLTDAHAGNYEESLLLSPEMSQSALEFFDPPESQKNASRYRERRISAGMQF